MNECVTSIQLVDLKKVVLLGEEKREQERGREGGREGRRERPPWTLKQMKIMAIKKNFPWKSSFMFLSFSHTPALFVDIKDEGIILFSIHVIEIHTQFSTRVKIHFTNTALI